MRCASEVLCTLFLKEELKIILGIWKIFLIWQKSFILKKTGSLLIFQKRNICLRYFMREIKANIMKSQRQSRSCGLIFQVFTLSDLQIGLIFLIRVSK